MTTTGKSRRKPTESAGDRLRREILGAYELTPVELVLLDQAVAVADVLERLNAQVATEALTAFGSTRQTVASPMLAAQREHSKVLAGLLGAIAVPAAGEDEGVSSTSAAARRAAHVRWAIHRERAAG